MTTKIDKQIEGLQAKQHDNVIRANLRKHCYDTLFFTYHANYKKKVHFAYLAYTSGNYCYAVLCKEDEWLSSHHDEGHPLDIVKLLDGEAIFMNWKEAVRDMCPECKKYLSMKQVLIDNAKALRLEGDKILQRATTTKAKLYQQALQVEGANP